MVEYNPFMDEIMEDPYPIYRRLREEKPAYYVEEYDAWCLSRFEDIWKSGANFKNLSAADGTTPGHLLTHDTPRNLSLSQMDPPRHSRYRAQVNPHFKPAVVKELESGMRTFAKGLADGFVGGGACDLVRDFAAKISIRGACTVGGLPVEEVDTMAGWVNGIFHRRKGHRGSTEVGEQAGKDMFVFILDWVKKHRVNPERATGILETLLTTEVDGALMDDFQVASTLSVVLIGGTDTLPKALGATFYRLWKNPDQRAAVVADPSLIPNAFLEALRIDTPTQMLGRTCTREIEYHDETVKPGQKVMFLWASANRDEREFENPDVYDITRHPQRMLAFGQGVHMCIGHHVAKLEARIALEEILSRVPEYEIQEDQCERARTEFVQGWLKLPVSFAPA